MARAVFSPLPPLASSGDELSPDTSERSSESPAFSPTGPRFEVSPSLSAGSGPIVRRQLFSPSSFSSSPSSPGPGDLQFEQLSLVIVKAEPQSPRVLTLGVGVVAVDGASSSASPLASGDAAAAGPLVVKRPRGRPRKHPKPDPEEKKKKMSPKARSKTGCGTCRRRKKKCDETKPQCTSLKSVVPPVANIAGISCEKNNVRCEGYPTKKYWLSGKQKSILKSKAPPLQHFTCSFFRPTEMGPVGSRSTSYINPRR